MAKKRTTRRSSRRKTVRRRRTFRKSRKELKHACVSSSVHVFQSLMRNTQVLSAANWWPMSGWPAQGTGTNNRIGDQIKVKYSVVTVGLGYGAQNIGCIYRLILFSIPNNQGITASSDIPNFFRATPLVDTAIHNPVNTEVYSVFYDKTFALNSGGNQIGQTYPGMGADVHKYHRIVLRKPYKYPVKFIPGGQTTKIGYYNICVALFCYQRGRPDNANLGAWTVGQRYVYYDD